MAAQLRDLTIRRLIGDDIVEAMIELAEAANFELTEEENRPFAMLNAWTNSRPAFIAAWRSNPTNENRMYLRFMTGLEACREGYSASLYHLERLRAVEGTAHALLKRFDFGRSMGHGTVGTLGQTRVLDYEYQAFVMAYRRSLDALAWGLSTYCKAEQSSFRRFARALPNYHPAPVAAALAEACARHIAGFDFVIGTERGQSVRDRIAHREAVQAGCVNVGAFGHRFLGGGEELGIRGPRDQRLADVLQARIEALHACISDILGSFRSAVIAFEADR